MAATFKAGPDTPLGTKVWTFVPPGILTPKYSLLAWRRFEMGACGNPGAKNPLSVPQVETAAALNT